MTEAELLNATILLARMLGYRVAHFRTALTGRGWKTAVAGDGAGFPDLLLVGNGRIVAAELKSAIGKVSTAQTAWLEAFRAAGFPAYVWRPADWHSGAIADALRVVPVRREVGGS